MSSEGKVIRLNLRVSDGLHPILFGWLNGAAPKLRCAKLSQYLELNLIADENGGVLRRADSSALTISKAGEHQLAGRAKNDATLNEPVASPTGGGILSTALASFRGYLAKLPKGI